MESNATPENKKQELAESLNPAELKRDIDRKLMLLYQVKHQSQKVEAQKKLHPSMVTFLIPQPESISVT